MTYLKSIIIVLSALFFLTGCETFGVAVKSPGASAPSKKYKKKGPPPHAPAHGYRHKHHDGHDLEFDTGLGAYIVLNIPDTYYANDLYMKMSTDGKWMVSTTLGGGWRVAAGTEIPPKLWHHGYNEKSQKGKHKKDKKDKKKKKHKYDD